VKKIALLVLALALLAGQVFAAGGQEAEAAPGVLKCAFIGGANYEELYKEIPKWEAQTGMKVEIVFKGDGFQIDKKLKTDFAAGAVDYDVCWDHSSFFTQYIKADGIVPLDDYFSAEELKDFIPMILNSGKRDGKLWIMPRHFDISCLHYRTDLFQQFGLEPPDTWDEFKAQCLKIQPQLPAGVYATEFAGKEEALTGRFYEVSSCEGAQFFDKNWKPGFNARGGVKAATMFRDLYKAGAMPPGMTSFVWEDVAKNWVAGNIVMYTEWYGWYSYFQDPSASKAAGKFDIVRQPKGDAGIHGGWAGQHAFSITKASKQKDTAADFIKFITSAESQAVEANLGFLVTSNSVWDTIIADAKASGKPLDAKRLELAQFQAANDFRTPPLVAEWLPASDIVYPIVQAIILGDKTPKAGLDEAAQKVEAMMKERGYY
jgi:multiple sugar transport system substrate-binding protein